MRNKITRKMIETTIYGFSVSIENGEPQIKDVTPVTVYGKVAHSKAVKLLKKAYPEIENVTVSKIHSEEIQLEITVDEFIKYAKRLKRPKQKGE